MKTIAKRHGGRRVRLGQTEGEERSAVERELAVSPAAQQEAAEIEQVAARLKEAARTQPPVEPSPALRTAVERRLDELEMAPPPVPSTPRRRRARAWWSPRLAAFEPLQNRNRRRPWWRRRLAALALTVACLVIVAVPVVQSLNLFGPRETLLAKHAPATGSANDPASKANLPSAMKLRDQLERLDIGANEDFTEGDLPVDPTLDKPAAPLTEFGGPPEIQAHGAIAIGGGQNSGVQDSGVIGASSSFGGKRAPGSAGMGMGMAARTRPRVRGSNQLLQKISADDDVVVENSRSDGIPRPTNNNPTAGGSTYSGPTTISGADKFQSAGGAGETLTINGKLEHSESSRVRASIKQGSFLSPTGRRTTSRKPRRSRETGRG